MQMELGMELGKEQEDITNSRTSSSAPEEDLARVLDQKKSQGLPTHNLASEMAKSEPVLTVVSFDTNATRYSYSSYVTKLHFRLRYAGIPYGNAFGSKFEAPKGKIPYVKFHQTGELLGDSGLIVKRLTSAGELEDLNAPLGPKQRATDLALRKAVEDGGYFITLYERWYDNYYTMRDRGPFASLPWGIRHVVAALAYRYARVMLYMQGTGRYTAEEVTTLREDMIGMLAGFAEAASRTVSRDSHGDDDDDEDDDGREPFWILGGEKPTEADFTVFGYLAGLVGTVTQPATTALIKSHPALVEYIARIHYRYFPDFEFGALEAIGKVHVE